MDDYTHETVRRQFTEAKGTSLARELLTSDFWMSGLAMLKYIPRWLRVEQVDGMAFFTDANDWPRVPGHEVVGRIDALGSGVQGWAVGQRVGVGFLGGSCGYCKFCRNGDLVNCRNQEF